MASEKWVCPRCQKEGGFYLLGKGWIVCEGCGQVSIVTTSGRVIAVGGRTPFIAAWARALGKEKV